MPAADLPVYWPLSSPGGWTHSIHGREPEEELVGSFFVMVGLGGSDRWPGTNKKAISISIG